MLRVLHIDKIDNDDAAQIAQAHLSRDRLSGLKIRLENRIVKAASTDKTARIDVDRGERFGGINDQIAARLESHFAFDCATDFVFNAVEIEDRPVALVTGQACRQGRHVVQGKRKEGVIRLGRVDKNGLSVFTDQVPHDSL